MAPVKKSVGLWAGADLPTITLKEMLSVAQQMHQTIESNPSEASSDGSNIQSIVLSFLKAKVLAPVWSQECSKAEEHYKFIFARVVEMFTGEEQSTIWQHAKSMRCDARIETAMQAKNVNNDLYDSHHHPELSRLFKEMLERFRLFWCGPEGLEKGPGGPAGHEKRRGGPPTFESGPKSGSHDYRAPLVVGLVIALFLFVFTVYFYRKQLREEGYKLLQRFRQMLGFSSVPLHRAWIELRDYEDDAVRRLPAAHLGPERGT